METKANTLLTRLCEVIDPACNAWLVGGAVRDQLAGKPCHDLDVILPDDVKQISRRAADALGGSFFPLDEGRGMYRVILDSEGQLELMDFSRIQGGSLEADLSLRDFTINAMAVRLHHPEETNDPMGGSQDLRDRILRPCSPQSFLNDPIRVVRAIRMALEFDLRMAPGTPDLIRQAVPRVKLTSSERKRDEFFKLLDCPHPASAIRLLDSLGILGELIPGLDALKGISQSLPHTMDVWDHSLTAMAHLDQILQLLINPKDSLEDGGNLLLGLTVGKLGQYRQDFQSHYQHRLNPFRTRRSLCLLAALLHDIGKPATRSVDMNGRIHFFRHEKVGAETATEIGRSLALSENEVQVLTTMTARHIEPRYVSAKESKPTRRMIYRFYRSTGEIGVDTCLLSLADFLSRTDYLPEQEAWAEELDRVSMYLDGWFRRKEEWITPSKLLSGDEIKKTFNLPAGRLIGEINNHIQESVAAGEISNRDEALELARKIVRRNTGGIDE